MARNYSNVATSTTLTGSINGSATTIAVGSVTGYPSAPFTIIVDPGLATEELVEVGGISGTSFTSCTRGVDGTPAQSHGVGATVVHGVSARDFREPNEHPDDTTSVHGIADTGALVTLTGTQTLTNKTLTSPTLNSPTFGGALSSPTINTPTITNPTITGGGSWAGSPTLTTPTINTGGTWNGSPTLVTPTIASFTNAQHTHTDAASGGTISAGGVELGHFYTEAAHGTFSATTRQQIGSTEYTFTAPSSWPSWATRIVYHMQIEAQSSASADHDLVINVRVDSTDLYQWTISCPDAYSTFNMATPATLPSAGSHTVKMMALVATTGENVNIAARFMWATLI